MAALEKLSKDGKRAKKLAARSSEWVEDMFAILQYYWQHQKSCQKMEKEQKSWQQEVESGLKICLTYEDILGSISQAVKSLITRSLSPEFILFGQKFLPGAPPPPVGKVILWYYLTFQPRLYSAFSKLLFLYENRIKKYQEKSLYLSF